MAGIRSATPSVKKSGSIKDDKDEGLGHDTIFAILNTQKALLRTMTKNVSRENVTLQQVNIMRILSQEGSVAMYRLGEELLVTRPNITAIIDRLEKKDLVKRVESKNDRRKTEIQFTAKGQKLYQKIHETQEKLLQDSINAFNSVEKVMLSRLLRKLVDEMAKRENSDNRIKE